MYWRIRYLLLFLFLFETSCNLVDNSIKGQLEIEGTTSTVLEMDLENCYATPPNGLYYTCSISTKKVVTQQKGVLSRQAINAASSVYTLTSNTCVGLSINDSGQLFGQIEKVASESCSLTVEVSDGALSLQKSIILTVAPSIDFSFDQAGQFIQEGNGNALISLLLSEPAPFDTFVEYDIQGDQNTVLEGISYESRRIEIKKGQTRVDLDVSIESTAGLTDTLRQLIKITSGSASVLPSVGLVLVPSNTQARSFSKMAAGANNSCGIENGKLFCWGSLSFGILGNGYGVVPRGTPTQIGTMSSWSEISIGNSWFCGIESGRLFCWGEQWGGKLGNGVNSTSTLTT